MAVTKGFKLRTKDLKSIKNDFKKRLFKEFYVHNFYKKSRKYKL